MPAGCDLPRRPTSSGCSREALVREAHAPLPTPQTRCSQTVAWCSAVLSRWGRGSHSLTAHPGNCLEAQKLHMGWLLPTATRGPFIQEAVLSGSLARSHSLARDQPLLKTQQISRKKGRSPSQRLALLLSHCIFLSLFDSF